MTQKPNPWTFDVRVRDRNLKAGTISDKDVDKYVSTLPDLAEQTEPFGTSQPALLQPPAAPAPAPEAPAAEEPVAQAAPAPAATDTPE